MPQPKPVVISTNCPDVVPFGLWYARFLHQWAEGNLSTARAKRADMKILRDYLSLQFSDVDRLSIWELTPSLFRAAIAHFLATGRQPSTVARYMATWTHFLNTVSCSVPNFSNPLEGESPPKPAKPKSFRWLTIEETTRFMSAIPTGTAFEEARVRFAIVALMTSGMRAFEMLALTEAHISPDMRFFMNVRRKARRHQHISIHDVLREELLRYLPIRRQWIAETCREKRKPIPNTGPIALFVHYRKGFRPFGYKTLWRRVGELCVQAGVRHVGVHSTRHTFAKRFIEAMPTAQGLKVLQAALGHSDVSTTMQYIENTDDEIFNAVNQVDVWRKFG